MWWGTKELVTWGEVMQVLNEGTSKIPKVFFCWFEVISVRNKIDVPLIETVFS